MADHADIDHTGLTGIVSLGAWTAYTPTVTATTTNPTLGSTTVTGRYKSLDSKTYLLYIEMAITTGGAWNAGSGNWEWSLPAGLTTVASRRQTLAAHVSTATRRYPGSAVIGGGATKIAAIGISDASGNHTVGAALPGTWATGEYIIIEGIIEVA